MNHEDVRHVGYVLHAPAMHLISCARSLCRVDLDDNFVTFKGLMQDQPILIVPCLYMFVMAVLSYAICVFER